MYEYSVGGLRAKSYTKIYLVTVFLRISIVTIT